MSDLKQNNENLAKSIAETEETAKPSPSELLLNDFLPTVANDATNELARISIKDFKKNPYDKVATYERGNVKFTIENFDVLCGPLSTLSKKLLDVAIVTLVDNNFGKAKTMPIVKIPLTSFGAKNGYDFTPHIMDTEEEQEKENNRVHERIKDFKDKIRRDLNDISRIRVTTAEKKGPNRGNYSNQGIISSHAIVRENNQTFIKITFDYGMAEYLSKSYFAQYPTSLLAIDNRDPNAYAIGRKMAFHNSNDHNAKIGTANTLKVSTLIDWAPEIQTYDELLKTGQRNWKQRIKGQLEKALNTNVRFKVINRWTYRDPKTDVIYTPEGASKLCWDEYNALDVDFETPVNPKQEERRKKKATKEVESTKQSSKRNSSHKQSPKKGGCS